MEKKNLFDFFIAFFFILIIIMFGVLIYVNKNSVSDQSKKTDDNRVDRVDIVDSGDSGYSDDSDDSGYSSDSSDSDDRDDSVIIADSLVRIIDDNNDTNNSFLVAIFRDYNDITPDNYDNIPNDLDLFFNCKFPFSRDLVSFHELKINTDLIKYNNYDSFKIKIYLYSPYDEFTQNSYDTYISDFYFNKKLKTKLIKTYTEIKTDTNNTYQYTTLKITKSEIKNTLNIVLTYIEPNDEKEIKNKLKNAIYVLNPSTANQLKEIPKISFGNDIIEKDINSFERALPRLNNRNMKYSLLYINKTLNNS